MIMPGDDHTVKFNRHTPLYVYAVFQSCCVLSGSEACGLSVWFIAGLRTVLVRLYACSVLCYAYFGYLIHRIACRNPYDILNDSSAY